MRVYIWQECLWNWFMLCIIILAHKHTVKYIFLKNAESLNEEFNADWQWIEQVVQIIDNCAFDINS